MNLATLELASARFDWARVYVAGVVNVTPDSFSDGGQHASPERAVAHAHALVAAGADLIDVGGESTRPGAAAVDAGRELERVVPVIEALAGPGGVAVPISVDTTKAAVAQAALAAGAEIVNDISGGAFDPDIISTTAAAGAVYICGHARGANLDEVHRGEDDPPDCDQVAFELAERVAGLPLALRHRTIIDPGLGFGKRVAENLALLRRAGELSAGVGCPVMVGPSRKRFIAALVGDGDRDMALRDRGTVGACLAAAVCGAHFVRTHDVASLVPALRVFEAALGAGQRGDEGDGGGR
ncbi:MAG: dihydropteroate synthase [Haliangiales bacterium]